MELQPSSFVNSSRSPETRQQQQTAQEGDEKDLYGCVRLFWCGAEPYGSCVDPRDSRQTAADDSSIANLSTCFFLSPSFYRRRKFSRDDFRMCWISIFLHRRDHFFLCLRLVGVCKCSSSLRAAADETSFSYVTMIVDSLGLCAAFQVTRATEHRKCVEA